MDIGTLRSLLSVHSPVRFLYAVTSSGLRGDTKSPVTIQNSSRMTLKQSLHSTIELLTCIRIVTKWKAPKQIRTSRQASYYGEVFLYTCVAHLCMIERIDYMSKLKLEVKCDKRIEHEVRSILAYLVFSRETISSFAEKVDVSRREIYRLFDGYGSYRQQSAVAFKILDKMEITSQEIAKLNNGLDKLIEMSEYILAGDTV